MGPPVPAPPRTSTKAAHPGAASKRQLDCFIGARIQLARTAKDVTLLQLSAACTIALDRLALLESGDLRTNPAELWDISHHLAQPISFFFSETQAHNNPRSR